jgi:ribonuclease HII
VAIVDGFAIKDSPVPHQGLVGGDGRSAAVAAASIVAKVHRDRLMVELDARNPGWGWRQNKGYGTAEHRRALADAGRSYLHRKTFRCFPVIR